MKTLHFITLALLFLSAASCGFGAGQLDLGAQYQSWNADTSLPFNGREILVPMTFSINPTKELNLYAQSEFASGNYTDSTAGTQTLNLTGVSDTVVGGEFGFQNFSLPSILSLGFNLPTGNQAWETETTPSNIPTEFVDDRYRGRGFGMSALYGISLPAGGAQYGAALGYMYSGAFNPDYGLGLPAQDLKLGDSAFFSLNRVTPYPSGQSEAIRASAFVFFPTYQNGQDLLWMGPNFNLSYTWVNPSAFSFEAGVQEFLPVQRPVNGAWTTEAHDSLAPRFYFNPAWSFGDFTLAGRAKYVMANGYNPNSTGDIAYYDGGGFLFGAEPSYKFKLDSQSVLKLSASYDYIDWLGAGGEVGSRVDIFYNRWTFGANYEIKL